MIAPAPMLSNPLEVLLFHARCAGKDYYEQMKGRGVRSLDGDSLKRVSNSADGAKPALC